jgi:sulfate transport system ATP-binding protein
VRKELRAWLRNLHERVRITTILVTHDQDEALEVADRLAVMDQGRLAQEGPPAELYDHPANEFVFRFLGPATRFQGSWVRPHDLQLSLSPSPGAVEAIVDRVVDLGFEIRVELNREGEPPFWVQLARTAASELRLRAGRVIWARSSLALGERPEGEHAAVAR